MGLINKDDYLKVMVDAERFFLIDKEDEWLLDHKWRIDNKGYVVRGKRVKGKYRMIRMHRVIMEWHGAELTNLEVDHINHVRHDNRKENLRVCSPGENKRNRRFTKGQSSKYKGVTYNPNKRLYEARIQVEHKYIFIGSFPNERLAAYWYNQAAMDLHGEFAELNDLS